MSYIKLLLVVLVSTLFVGCAHYTPHNPYSQASPVIKSMRDSGGMQAHPSANGSLRNDPNVILAGSLKKASAVEIAVVFDYVPPRRGREASARKCELFITTPDTTPAKPYRCKMRKAGNTFMVTYKPERREYRSFDLLALGGHCQGGCPFYFYNNGFIHLTLSGTGRSIPVKYVYFGPDPFQ